MIVRETYDLPDKELLEDNGEKIRFSAWVPQEIMVVIGKGSNSELEVKSVAVNEDKIPVIRRGTGGCAVVLTPDMFVTSFAVHSEIQSKSSEYFKLFNHTIISALEDLGVANLSHRGISDIALGEKKVAGTALYRNRSLVFYHSILNTAGNTDIIERYLKYPPRTPDYRKDRSHKEFVTSLTEHGYSLSFRDYDSAVKKHFSNLSEKLSV